MRIRPLAVIFLGAALAARAEPMPSSVESWEGVFTQTASPVAIRMDGLPPLQLWLYQLDTGSRGTCVGFAREDGGLLLAPVPNGQGVQPVYTGYSVILEQAPAARIIVMYDIQGNGRMRMVEAYRYDGRQVTLASHSVFHGKHDPVWRKPGRVPDLSRSKGD